MSGAEQTPLIAVIATGGTIASRKDDTGAASPALSGQDLLDLLPPMQVRLRPIELLAQDSSSLTLTDMQRISDAVAEQVADAGITGVVVMHGTDSMEETALLLHLQGRGTKPVLLTGAQFAADSEHPDGPGNLAQAIAGVLDGTPGIRLAFGGRMLPVWGLYKAASDSADAFALAEETPLVPDLPALSQPVAGLRVDLVALAPGADGLHIDASIGAGARGIVLVALGSGNATAAVVQAVARAAAAGVPVVTSSRVPKGVLAPAYGGGGGGHDLVQAGAVHSRLLRPGQARVLLAAMIANGQSDADSLTRVFGRS